MYNRVTEFAQEGLSISQISRNTGLDRVTVRKYLHMTEEEFSAFLALQKQHNRKLQPYEEFIKKRVTDYPDCSAAQVEDWLIFNFRLHKLIENKKQQAVTLNIANKGFRDMQRLIGRFSFSCTLKANHRQSLTGHIVNC
jgi:hypothetical protein